MPKITRIEPQRRKGRFNIYLDDEFCLGVSEEVILILGLKEGLFVDKKKIKEFEEKEEEQRVLNSALRFLSYRPRSEKEMLDRLRAKRFSREAGSRSAGEERVIKKIIKKLKKENYLNDKDFVKAWLENRELFRPSGKKLLFLELKQKGVNEDLIKKILDKEYDDEKEFELAQKAVEKKLKIWDKQKILEFLARRGFSFRIIEKVLSNTSL